MGYVKLIENLFDRSNVVQKANHFRSGREVYSIERRNGVITLLHYGTKTLEIEHGKIRHIYGLSRSDVDSINTLLDNLNIDSFRVGFKPVNGGFYAWIPSLKKELFLNHYENYNDFARGLQSHLDQNRSQVKLGIIAQNQPMPVL